jgi:hypothetical protein
MCYTKCPKGLYLEGTTCLPCKDSCASCSSWDDCTSCIPDAVLANGACPYKLSFPYLMPSLVVACLWMGFTSDVEFKKKASRWIPLTIVGLTFCNKSLAFIELFMFGAYNLPKLFVYTLLAGFILPTIFSALFVVVWKYKFLHDLNVKNHYDNHRILHVSMLLATFIGDYRSWKYLYTNINNHTSLLCFKV